MCSQQSYEVPSLFSLKFGEADTKRLYDLIKVTQVKGIGAQMITYLYNMVPKLALLIIRFFCA